MGDHDAAYESSWCGPRHLELPSAILLPPSPSAHREKYHPGGLANKSAAESTGFWDNLEGGVVGTVWRREEIQEDGTHACLWLTHADVWRDQRNAGK